MYEVELRARTLYKNFQEKLNALDVKKIKETNQVDIYYKFVGDIDRKLVIRIREMPGKTKLTFKGSSKFEQDIAWQEWENEITDANFLKKLMLSNGIEEVCQINKQRTSYQIDGFEVNYDRIKKLGDFIEVEIITDNVEIGTKMIRTFMHDKLGLSEKDIVTKGYVPLMIEHMQK